MPIPCESCRISEYLKPEANDQHTKEGCRFQRKCLARLFWFQAEFMDYIPPTYTGPRDENGNPIDSDGNPVDEDWDPCDIINTAYHFDKYLDLLLREYFE